jgi:hypothetical protein
MDYNRFLSEIIFFAQLKDDVILDKIPLNEVEQVREKESNHQERRSSREAEELMIETHHDGYNSGRVYYLQAESKAFCQELIQKLKQYCSKARERANSRTAMAQAQQFVGKIYRSTYFQNFVAVLIIMVCSKYTIEPLGPVFSTTDYDLMHEYMAEFRRLRARRAIQKRGYQSV